MSAPPPAFDRTPGACSACAQQKADPLVSCMECETIVHVHCYPSAKKDRRWLCDLCSVQLVESSCVLCGQTSECGILQRVSDAEYARIHPTAAAAHAAMKAAPAHFAHSLCLSLYRSSPSRPAPCRLCHGESARLSCEICTVSHHPFCALRSPATLQLTPSGNILCYCDRHLKTNATAAITPPVLPLMALPQLTRPPPPAATIAMPSAAAAGTSAAAAAASPAKATTTAPARSPSVKREAESSPSAAAAAAAVAPTAAAPSVTAPAAPAAPAASAASVRPVAKITAPIAAASPAAPTAAIAAAVAAAPSTSPAASPSASPTAAGLSKKEQFAARLKASSPPASVAAAAQSNGNGRDTTPTAAEPAHKRATAAAAAATPTAKPASKSAAAAASAKPAASSKAAAASAAAAVAASAKPAKPASSSSSAASAKSVRGNGKAAPAAAAASSSRFTSHPSLRSGAATSSDDEDEGEAEWTGNDVPSAEHDKKLIQKALNQIKEIHEESKEIDEEKCRVCGEDWAEDAVDEDGNPTNDEMVFCEGCKGYYHQSCYGIDVVPAGDFFCWPCKDGEEQGEVRCVICKGKEWRGFCEVKYDPSRTDRAVIKAARKHKHFAHTACVLWSPDTFFDDIVHRNPACGIENIPAAAFKLKCVKCSRLDGAKLQCSYKECVQSFHPLCMLNHPDEFFRDAHEEDMQAVPKEYFCAHHSKRVRRERERARLVAAGESTEEIDAEIEAETPAVVPTTALLPAAKLVTVVPLKQGGRKIVRIEVDTEDQELRAKQGEEAAVKVKIKREMEEEEGADSSGDDSSRRPSKASKARAAKRKAASIDADVESVDSDSSADSRSSITKRRRLRKGTAAADAQPRMKLELSGAAGASSSDLAAGDIEISSSSNAQIDTRRAVRNQLMRLMDASLANRIEAGVYQSCGRSTSDRYKQRATDLHYNLSRNEPLLASIKDGGVTVARLLEMDNRELATESQKRARASEQAETIRDKTAAPHAVLLTGAGERVAIDPSTGKRINSAKKK